MPRRLNKPKPIELVLKCDQDLEGPKPTFIIEPLSFGQSKSLAECLDNLERGVPSEMFDEIRDIYLDVIKEVRNFDQSIEEIINNILTFSEVMELFGLVLSSGQLSESEGN